MSASDNHSNDVGSGNNQGCDSTSSSSWMDFLKSLCDLKDLFEALLDAGARVTTSVSKHLEELSKIEAFITHCQTIHTMDDLKGDLETVKNALSIFVHKVEVFSCIIQNDEIKKSITESLKRNDHTPLKEFLAKVQHLISEVTEAYQEFYRVYRQLKDSSDRICQLFAQHLSTVKCKKHEIKWNGTFWTAGFGVVALGLGIFGIAALAGYVTLTTVPAILVAVGCSATTVCSVGSGVMNGLAYSHFLQAEQQLKAMESELDVIAADILTLKNKGTNVYIALQQCAFNADKLLQLCEEQGYAETITMLNEITMNTEHS